MKRTRAQQPKATDQPQDPALADAGSNPKPQQRRAKQPRQPKGGAKKPAAATPTAAAANAAASNGPEAAPTVPDVCFAGDADGAAAGAPAVDCWGDLDAGFGGGDGAWWTWGVDEEMLLGWFPFVEEDFRCLGGRAADAAEVAAIDDDIWRIHQIYEIPNYATK